MWNVESLNKGIHRIYFRAIDEESDNEIIDESYKIITFDITKSKELLPDLKITNIIIKNKYNEVTSANNGENLTFDVTINVDNANRIKKETVIYVKLSIENTSLDIVEKRISKTEQVELYSSVVS